MPRYRREGDRLFLPRGTQRDKPGKRLGLFDLLQTFESSKEHALTRLRMSIVTLVNTQMAKETPLPRQNAGISRLGPSIIRRKGLEDWLERSRSVPVRFLVAPAGFGKTIALAAYLRNVATNGRYCSLSPSSTQEATWNAAATALQLPKIGSHEQLLHELETRGPLELAIDCEEATNAEGIGALVRLIDDLPENVSLLIACRSWASLDVGRFVFQGKAVLCDAGRLAFDATDIRHVAETLGVSFTHAEVLHVLEATDGWPQVVSGALRKAAEDGCSLAQAVEHWRKHHGHFFNRFIADALAHVPQSEADLVFKLMSGSHLDDRSQLEALESQGLFVVRTSDGYRPLRALSLRRPFDRCPRVAPKAQPPMRVSLLGWFQADINGQPIAFVRRRDQQLFKYIALQPNGCVSRAELLRVFWPGVERSLAAQSLRTACSQIRRAIIHIVGFDEVGAYFRASDEFAIINLSNVIVDVKCFLRHADDGDENYNRGDLRGAYAHYSSLARVYRNDLLISDAREPWVVAFDTELKLRHGKALARMAEWTSLPMSVRDGKRLAAVPREATPKIA